MIEWNYTELHKILKRQLKRLHLDKKVRVHLSPLKRRPKWVTDPDEFYGITDLRDFKGKDNRTYARIWIDQSICKRDNIDLIPVLLHEIRHVYNWIILFPDMDEKLAMSGERDDYKLYQNGEI